MTIFRSWLVDLPGPVAVTCEAGPTGFGLYRSLTAAGIRCEVAAPSKLQRPSGDRVKTDAKDAAHLAGLQGSITRTGNGHARRLLAEAAWHHRPCYEPGTMRDRWELASPAARARSDLGNRRLHARLAKYIDRKKKATVANTTNARELAGWCWSPALHEERHGLFAGHGR